jgi:hypothetical protein
MEATNASFAWQILEDLYQGSTISAKTSSVRDFFNYKLTNCFDTEIGALNTVIGIFHCQNLYAFTRLQRSRLRTHRSAPFLKTKFHHSPP